MRHVVIFSLALSIMPIRAHAGDSFVFVGKPGKTTSAFIGCTSLEKLDRLKELMRQGDRQAAFKFVMNNECNAVDAGTKGIVESNSVWSNATCLRPVGETECVWLPMPLVVAN